MLMHMNMSIVKLSYMILMELILRGLGIPLCHLQFENVKQIQSQEYIFEYIIHI